MTDTICGHEGCTCQAREDGFCSDYCAEHVGERHGDEAHQCGCGHAHCEMAAGAA